MEVRIADLKNNLSRHLKTMQRKGESIIILDRNEPIGIISPITTSEDIAWRLEREATLARAKQLGVKLTIPERRPGRLDDILGKPTIAPDGRTDINTVVEMRAEKDY